MGTSEASKHSSCQEVVFGRPLDACFCHPHEELGPVDAAGRWAMGPEDQQDRLTDADRMKALLDAGRQQDLHEIRSLLKPYQALMSR